MSKDDSNRGFLSKVVKFVRHPTTSWSDLDTRSADRESEYSKAALKEMIERKRRNDFVRKREFEMLRKVRSREGSADGSPGVRPSFFQSSLPSKPDDRAMTLKKIDEIEAQMSMQWWKTKGPDSLTTGSSLNHSTGGSPLERKAGGAKPPEPSDSRQLRRNAQYSETEAAGLAHPTLPPTVPATVPATMPGLISPRHDDESPGELLTPVPAPAQAPRPYKPDTATMPARVMSNTATAVRSTGLMAPSRAPDAGGTHSSLGFSASHFLALDVHEIAQDPDVEEAAIRFANGDDRGAEQGLMDALGSAQGDASQDDWLALFDLYRATGQQEPFESQALDFVNRFGRSAPQWYDMPAAVAAATGKTFTPSTQIGRANWVCEPVLDAHAVGGLQNVLLRAAPPWVLDWSALESIDLKAARALLGIFTLWGDQDTELCFIGASHLRDCLKTLTPSGRRDVEQLWWELRMAALRVMNAPDEFELTALDFCVTYEVSPPGWEAPHCHFRSLISGVSQPGSGGSTALSELLLESLPPSSLNDSGEEGQSTDFQQLGLVEMSGEIRGDAQEVVEGLQRHMGNTDVLVISCRNLIRVDFSAAGALLNWVSSNQAQGRIIQFVDVHRLVSAFFHVIGITECAKVVLRHD